MRAQGRSGARWLGGLVGAAVVVWAASGGWQAASANTQAGPTFSVSPASQTVPLSAGTATVDIQISSVTDVGSFGFVLRYDPGVLKDPAATASAFLGSSGRQVQCLSTIGFAGPGTVKFGCGTLGQQAGASAAGTTTVASVTFTLAGGSQSSVSIESDQLEDVARYGVPLCVADTIPTPTHADYLNTCPVQNGSITVSGGDSAKNQGIAPAPTQAPQTDNTPGPAQPGQTDNTPAPASPTPGPGTPTAAAAAVQSGSARAPGDTASGVTGPVSAAGGGTGSVAGAGTAAGRAGASGGVGRLGSGTAQRHRGDNALVWVLAIAGAVLVPAGMLVRRRAVR